ncbi:hypothetical protein BT96DRAFT_991072 [Gymnopus androsaceus JB14]|uniref:Uncharacterized protein n=1 Tax=Gymnopus androsaceus JB14 TaxID=1447944 RepID=A0A6A4HXX2_9AGAR|nr:hypothetical protein BT96DRAFT_991072 [Gymnopus androsaceus JB14]
MDVEPPFKIYPDPEFRGTYNLVSSCIVTLGLCVWTAVHLDVPTSSVLQYWRKVKWVMLGMLAPELLLFIACLQWFSARRIQDEADECLKAPKQRSILIWLLDCPRRLWIHVWKKIYAFLNIHPDRDDHEKLLVTTPESITTTYSRKFPWTSTHSFYACMGGFVFSTGQLHPPDFFPENQTRIPVTAHGVTFLFKYAPEIIPDISQAEIADKSKAGSLAKLLTCLQALWFCMQFIARTAQHLSFSLLELNTLAHAICAISSYCLWWSKPLDVAEPTLMSCDLDSGTREACAMMCILSGIVSSGDSSNDDSNNSGTLAEGDGLIPKVHKVKRDGNDIHVFGIHVPNDHDSVPQDELDSLNPWQRDIVLLFEKLGITEYEPSSTASDKGYYRAQLKLARQWIQQHSTFEWTTEGSALPVTRDFAGDYNHALVVLQGKLAMDEIMGLRWKDLAMLWQDPYILTRAIFFCFIGAAYGGVHAIAWNYPFFPTAFERMIWRYSAVAISTFAFCVPIMQKLLNSGFWKKRKANKFLIFLIWLLLIPTISVIYSIARLYIVAESLRQVFFLPSQVFLEPQFTKYLPHFS